MLVYIEFISRRPGIGLHEFHAVAGGGQTGWAGEYDDDVAVLNVGRSWRIGPEPEYMCAWYSRDAGMERIDEWERVFRSGVADNFEEPFRLAARIDAAGCYEPLREPVVGSKGRYYAEWFDVAEGADHDAVRDSFDERRGRHPDMELNLLVDRIGHLGPEPRRSSKESARRRDRPPRRRRTTPRSIGPWTRRRARATARSILRRRYERPAGRVPRSCRRRPNGTPAPTRRCAPCPHRGCTTRTCTRARDPCAMTVPRSAPPRHRRTRPPSRSGPRPRLRGTRAVRCRGAG